MSKLILVRGMPGSGKSTLANKLVPSMVDKHFEADQYFVVEGKYVFSIEKLGRAHEWCQNKTASALRDGYSVVVANTFTTTKELKPYFEIAKPFEIIPQVILCQASFGSIHCVPEETIHRMKTRFEYDISSLYSIF